MNTVRKAILSAILSLIACAPRALAQGTYTQVDYPGAAWTVCTAIDTAGDIVGYYWDGSTNNGFLLSNGSYVTIDYPGATGTLLYGINDLGQIVGRENGNNPNIGFSYNVNTQAFTIISYPSTRATIPYAINDGGTIAGQVGYGTSAYGFELVGSRYHPVPPPRAVMSQANGISTSGDIVGYVTSSSGAINNFESLHGRYRGDCPEVR